MRNMIARAACLLATLWLVSFSEPAQATCTGQFAANSVCGTGTSAGVPGPVDPMGTAWYTAPFTGGVAESQSQYNRQRVSIVDFGAIGDGNISNATTNATALTNALATGKCAFIPWTSSGYHFGTNTFTVGTGQCILGENQVILKSTTASYFLHVTSFEVTAAPATIENITINMSGAGASSTAIRFATSSGVVAGAQVSQILCLNAVECIGDEVHAANYVTDIKMYDIRAILTLGRQIYIRRSRGFMWLDTIRIDQTQSGQTVPVTWNGAQFDDIIGLEINRLDVVGPTTAQTTTYQSGSTGLVVTGAGSGLASVWLNRILVDNTSGNGIALSNFNYLNANWVESFGNLGNGITLTTIQFSEITNMFSVGAVGVAGAAAGANGVACNPCSNLNISNLLSSNYTGNGLSISGASSAVAISNYQATGNTGFATALGGTAANISIYGGSWTTNGGLLSNGSTGGNIVIRAVNGYPWRTAIADANYTALASDDVISYSSIASARTVTLPAASLFPQGRVLVIEDVSGSASTSNTISAAPNGTDTINGSNTTQVMVRSARGSVGLQSNGSGGWTFAIKGVNAGGTGLGSGTSGGVPYFSSTTTIASSGALTANGVVLGGGAGATPTTTSAGTTGQVLTGVTGSAPTFQSLRQNISLSGNAGFAGGSTGFMVYAGGGTESIVSSNVAMAGTFRNLYGAVNVAPGGADTVVFTLRVNGSDTGITCTITGAATTCNDTTHTATITAGQLWSVKTVYSATAAASVPKGAIEFDNP